MNKPNIDIGVIEHLQRRAIIVRHENIDIIDAEPILITNPYEFVTVNEVSKSGKENRRQRRANKRKK